MVPPFTSAMWTKHKFLARAQAFFKHEDQLRLYKSQKKASEVLKKRRKYKAREKVAAEETYGPGGWTQTLNSNFDHSLSQLYNFPIPIIYILLDFPFLVSNIAFRCIIYKCVCDVYLAPRKWRLFALALLGLKNVLCVYCYHLLFAVVS